MENNTTTWLAAGCAGLTLTIAVLITNLGDQNPAPGAPPSLEVITAQAAAYLPRPASVNVTRPSASWRHGRHHAAKAPPAPGGESAPRTSATAADRVAFALGERAKAMIGERALAGFRTAQADEFAVDFADCSDRDAVELQLMGRVEAGLIGASLSPRELGAGAREVAVGLELWALAVARDFPLDSMSTTQMRQVLTGQVTDWQQFGYDRGPVVVVLPAERDLAERAAATLIHGDAFSQKAVRVADDRGVADRIVRDSGALAVVRVKSTAPVGMKLLQIDWTPPTPNAFAYGNYPFGVPLHVIMGGRVTAPVQGLIDYLRSPDGHEHLDPHLLITR